MYPNLFIEKKKKKKIKYSEIVLREKEKTQHNQKVGSLDTKV